MTSARAWDGVFSAPHAGRVPKPRRIGLNIVIDKSLGTRALADLLETAGSAVDHIKFAFGTSVAISEDVVRAKVEMIRAAGIEVYPGGTLGEAAVLQGVLPQYLQRARDLGFTMVEVSDGTISMTAEVRAEYIGRALDLGLGVISEVGKKDPRHQMAVSRMQALIASDLNLGASYVVIEARESGHGVGIYDATGAVDQVELAALVNGLQDLERIIWEAPQTSQQAYLLQRFGVNVNLGNIPPLDVLAVEALRSGLRFETLRPLAAERGMLAADEGFIARFLTAAQDSIGA